MKDMKEVMQIMPKGGEAEGAVHAVYVGAEEIALMAVSLVVQRIIGQRTAPKTRGQTMIRITRCMGETD